MAYYVGDIPSEDIVIEPARGEDAIDLAPFTQSETEIAWRHWDEGIILAEFTATFDNGVVVIEWPDVSPFLEPGLHVLEVTLVGADARERLAPVYIVAQAEDGWHTIDSARTDWDGAPPDDYRLWQLLELAKQQVTEYAPRLEADAPVPVNYRNGQLMQARNLLNAALVDPSGSQGVEGFTLQPFPLDWMVQQVLRPKRAVPRVG